MGQFESLPQLVGLDLSYNAIAYISPGAFQGLNLSYLDLTNNHLKSLSPHMFEGICSTLRELHLNDNQIASLDASSCFHELQILTFKNNLIASVNYSAFKDLRNLVKLDLQV